MTVDPQEGAQILRGHIEETAAATSKPFAVNVPVGRDSSGRVLPVSAAYIDAVLQARADDRTIADQLRVIITSAGYPGEFRERISASGLVHAHKVGSTRQAVKAVAAGVDAVIASGYEMGGHTHAAPVHTFVLVPNVTQSVDVPVVLSGGARDGRSLAAALALGADAIAMGTRFIATEDNVDWHPAYREIILNAGEGDDVIFPAVYGPARGLRNQGVKELFRILESGELDDEAVTRWKDEALVRAQRHGDVENGLVAAGQVASGINDIVAISRFIPALVEDAARILAGLTATVRTKEHAVPSDPTTQSQTKQR
jgi:NAD(P)H-dependent flavin oxidoreductase YrpB (nitropropane dioxygenase family)